MSSPSRVGGGVQVLIVIHQLALVVLVLKQSKKKLRFESDSKEFAEKEKQMRAADGAKGAKFAMVKQPALQKKSLSTVAEEGVEGVR
uniref:Uncharacterized protein n=1 Tax=Aegilops tauschii TaxID=37682 RepID=M8CN78_AEGTA